MELGKLEGMAANGASLARSVMGFSAAWTEFEWVPDELLILMIRFLKTKHEKDGWGSIHGNLWNQDTMVFIGCSKGLMEMLTVATKSWRSNKRHEAQTYLVSIVLAIEVLGSNFVGWGDRYPEAKRKADEILNESFTANRTRLLDIYMPLRAQIDQNELREVLGPGALAAHLDELRRFGVRL
jgi:hypothetical protein